MTTVQLSSKEDMFRMSDRFSVFSVHQDQATAAPMGRDAGDGKTFLAALRQSLASPTMMVNREPYGSLADGSLTDSEKRSDLSVGDLLNALGMLLTFMATPSDIDTIAHGDDVNQGMSGPGQAKEAWAYVSNRHASLLNALLLETSSFLHDPDGEALDSFFTALNSMIADRAHHALFSEALEYGADRLQKTLAMMQNTQDDPQSLKALGEWHGALVKRAEMSGGVSFLNRLPFVLSSLGRIGGQIGAWTNEPSDEAVDERAQVSKSLAEKFFLVTSLDQSMHGADRAQGVNKLLEALRQRYEALFRSIERLDNEQKDEHLPGHSDHPPRVTDELPFLQSKQLFYGADLWRSSEHTAKTPSLPAPLKALLLHIQAAQQGRPGEVVHLRLEPETLGELWIRIHVEGQSVSLMVMASKESAGTWLKTHGRELQASLEGQGLQLVRLDVLTSPAEEDHMRFTFDQGGDRRKEEREARERAKNASRIEDDFKETLEMAVT